MLPANSSFYHFRKLGFDIQHCLVSLRGFLDKKFTMTFLVSEWIRFVSERSLSRRLSTLVDLLSITDDLGQLIANLVYLSQCS